MNLGGNIIGPSPWQIVLHKLLRTVSTYTPLPTNIYSTSHPSNLSLHPSSDLFIHPKHLFIYYFHLQIHHPFDVFMYFFSVYSTFFPLSINPFSYLSIFLFIY